MYYRLPVFGPQDVQNLKTQNMVSILTLFIYYRYKSVACSWRHSKVDGWMDRLIIVWVICFDWLIDSRLLMQADNAEQTEAWVGRLWSWESGQTSEDVLQKMGVHLHTSRSSSQVCSFQLTSNSLVSFCSNFTNDNLPIMHLIDVYKKFYSTQKYHSKVFRTSLTDIKVLRNWQARM